MDGSPTRSAADRPMRVFVVGSTGALGLPVVRALLRDGHEVTGLTRSEDKARLLRSEGASAAIADVFDEDRLASAMKEAAPEACIQLLNSLPKRGPTKISDLDSTNELRTRGTANVLAAAIGAGSTRFVAESMIFGYGYGRRDELITEEAPFGSARFGGAPLPALGPALDALVSLEEQVLNAARAGSIEGIVLRYGMFYGPEAGHSRFMTKLVRRRMLPLPGGGKNALSFIHVDDGAEAAVAALDRAPSGSIYNVVDDEPVRFGDFVKALAREVNAPKPFSIPMWLTRVAGDYAKIGAQTTLRVSNEKIKRELGWEPLYPTYREGLKTFAPADKG